MDTDMRLDEIKKELKIAKASNYKDVEITGITQDSRKVRGGYLFCAYRGTNLDGYSFIGSAIENGAAAVIAERKEIVPEKIPLIIVEDGRKALADASACFFGYPSRDVDVIGVTGTNGKTTTAYIINSIFGAAGHACGLLGTISYRIGKRNIPADVTTPESVDVESFLAEMRDAGIRKAVMEVSSHALDQSRVRGIIFKCAVFTNLSSEHLDYHISKEAYEDAKSILFKELPEDSRAIININDEAGRRMIARTAAKVTTFGLGTPADLTARIKEISLEGTDFEILAKGLTIDVKTSLIGEHNVYNILAAASCGLEFDVDSDKIKEGIEAVKAVPGRLERVSEAKDFAVFVDYAHTDDALNSVLSFIRPLAKGRLMVVFGCGGDRDKQKRPRMGAVVEKYADRAWITNDNPRTEDPLEIIEHIKSGIVDMSRFRVEPDRAAAIAAALSSTAKGDVVIIAGKGHETYQKLKDKVIPFDDREVVKDFFERE